METAEAVGPAGSHQEARNVLQKGAAVDGPRCLRNNKDTHAEN